MTSKVVVLKVKAGIQRDGTQFMSDTYVDGEWVRFQYGRPRKIAGYYGTFNYAAGISRGMTMSASNGVNYVVSGYSNGLEQWTTGLNSPTGSGPTEYTISSGFTASANNLWQFDIGYDPYGTGINNLIAHPGQNLNDISSTVNTRPLIGAFTSTTVSPVGIFTATAALTNTSATVTVTGLNAAIYGPPTGVTPYLKVTGTNIPANTYVLSATVAGGNTSVVLSNAATATATGVTLTFDNQISVSGGVCMLYPYLFVYGNNGLIQNCDAGNFNNWSSGAANATNVASTKVVKGLPLRGGTTSPAGLFWTLDSLVRVTYAPTTVGSSVIYWRYDLITQQSSIMSSQCVIEYDGIYYWCGVDRFLQYNGVVQEIPNSQNQNWFFDNLNFSQRQKVWVSKVPRWGEIWWFYPRGDATECTDAIIYNVREKTWYDAGEADGARRSAGVFSEVFIKPIWAGNDALGYQVNAVTIVSGGTGYKINDVVKLTGGGGAEAAIGITSVSGTVVTGVRLINGGLYDYNVSGTTPTKAFGSSGGTGLTLSVTSSLFYTLWQHETGTDKVFFGEQNAIPSSFETNTMGQYVGLVGTAQQPGDNVFTRCERIEPDFIQSGNMNVVVTGKGYADDADQPSDPYTFDVNTLKIDMREQRREMRLRFESNEVGGDYFMGQILLSLDTGDVRSTGSP